MANGIVRLERFFSSRRKSSSTPSSESNSPVASSEPQFPSPSFIRPKASRMTAREETYFRQALRPTFALDGEGAPVSPAKAANLRLAVDPVKAPADEEPTILRPASFEDARCDSLFNNVYQFPTPPREHVEQLPLVDSEDIESIFDGFTSDSSESTTASDSQQLPNTPARIATPPTAETTAVEDLVDTLNKALPSLPLFALDSQEQDKPLKQATGWDPEDSVAIDIVNTNLVEDIERSLGERNPKPSLHHSSSEPNLSRVSWRKSRSISPSSVLWEPDFNDFMTLSDDDIAESSMASALAFESMSEDRLPPTPPLTASTDDNISPRPRSLLTLSPPYTSKPAAAAAYEAARIATRYDFDLIYVVNLWPDNTRPRTPSLDQAGCTMSSASSPYHMTGRLLAAYGLENVQSPFQITTSVHTKVLRSDGWIEYRSQEARSDEFARGYACSFFTGQYARSNSIDSNASANSRSSRNRIDRGVVFAAYRKPREDGSMRCSDETELKAIKQDAEGLVEMVLDMHAAYRRRQAPLFNTEDTAGPIPDDNSTSGELCPIKLCTTA